MVISRVYCSGVAWPGMMALFSPSMPMQIAPLRLTLAFSSSNTLRFGLLFFRLHRRHGAGGAAAHHDQVVFDHMRVHCGFLVLFFSF